MSNGRNAKEALDKIIKKSRVHLYKPIQIAEILRKNRLEKGWDLRNLESYRNISKKWRDEVSLRLVGRKSTSSQKYQDNLFESNAMLPVLLEKLGSINRKTKGMVEAYIYQSLGKRLSVVKDVQNYIKESSPESFSLKRLISLFVENAGLKRSVDKIYEISVYALFSTIVRALKAQISLEIRNKDKNILNDFSKFIEMVLGIAKNKTKIILPAALYRMGVTNAADRGLDMWANFGAAIQVKHLTLTPDVVENIAGGILADRIVIVCLTSEKKAIEGLLRQVGWGNRIQGIITINDLEKWYQLCLSNKYKNKLGKNLLGDIGREFNAEFPSGKEQNIFMQEKGYDKISLTGEWKID